MNSSPPERLSALDGLRGWAALSVVVYHYCWEVFGVTFPAFRSAPASFLGNGGLAVAIFFTLSGYVLTLRRWGRAENASLPIVLIRRYLRLVIPITAAVLIAWALMALKLTPTRAAALAVERPDWLGIFARFPPNFLEALWFSTDPTYWLSKVHSYGPFLWTMTVELFGSLIVLTLSHYPRIARYSYIPLVIMAGIAVWRFPLPLCFAAGAIIALMQHDRVIFRDEPSPRESTIATIVLAAALLAAAWFQMYVTSLLPPSILGIVIFLCACRSRPVQAFLTTPVSAWLGRISFPLYLIQYPVLIAASTWLILAVSRAHALTPWSALAIAIAGIGMTVLAAWAFYPVELFTLRTIKRIAWRPAAAAGVKA